MSFLKRGKKGKTGEGDFPNSPTATTTPTSVSIIDNTASSDTTTAFAEGSPTTQQPQPQQPQPQSSSVSTTTDDDTVVQSGNTQKVTTTSTSKASLKSDDETTDGVPASSSSTDEVLIITSTPKKSRMSKSMTPGSTSGFVVSLAEELRLAQEQIAVEKAGKRKLFHSLVKVANELRKTREEQQVKQDREVAERTKQWYDGGLWRAPQILPSVQQEHPTSHHYSKSTQRMMNRRHNNIHDNNNENDNENHENENDIRRNKNKTVPVPPSRGGREAISLSDLFFHLVIVTAFTRVGVAISIMGYVDVKSLLYFAIFWNIWSKEASYTSRFDTTDLSAQMENLVTCFAVLFGSLSVSADINSVDGTRIMIMACAVAILHCALHIRVAISNYRGQTVSPAILTTTSERSVVNPLTRHVFNYALFIIIATALEAATWMVGILIYSYDWPYRWCVVVAGILLGLRVPRAFLANDFHAASSQRGVLFILLLGFLLQSIVVVASEFFEYQTPTLAHYSFIGAACLMLFCIKLLYVTDDADTIAEDHALLVNRFAGFFFNVGQFSLLLSTTVMGSGLNLLTHDYLAASAALPGPAKTLVTGGFAAVLLSTFFIKSLHLKRVPTDPRNRALFIGAYVIQGVVLFVVVAIAAAMSFGVTFGLLEYLMQTDIQLLFSLSGSALFVVIMSWLDEGVELMLYNSAADSREYRVHPFGLWWFLTPDVTISDMDELVAQQAADTSSTRLSVLSPLLGSSLADLKLSMYNSISTADLDMA